MRDEMDCVDTSIISLSSDETMIRSKHLLSLQAWMVHAIRGFPRKFFTFFLGRRLLPPRAGMTATRVPEGACAAANIGEDGSRLSIDAGSALFDGRDCFFSRWAHFARTVPH